MTDQPKSKGINISLWIAQVILSGMFLMAGVMKFTTPIEDQRKMEWAKHVSVWLIHFTGFAEILGAIGLLLPTILKIKPQLTPWAIVEG